MSDDKIVYGVNLNGEITSFAVRDALVECFFEAHCADAGLGTDDPKTNKEYILELIKKTFADTGEDFNKPTKNSLLKVMEKLKEFAADFRDQSIIKKHATEMVALIEKINE